MRFLVTKKRPDGDTQKFVQIPLSGFVFGVTVVALAIGMLAFSYTTKPTATASASDKETAKNESMVQGSESAKVSIIEYADPLCTYCAKFAEEVLTEVKDKLVNANDVTFEFRPVALITDNSKKAAETMFCAADQGKDKFWAYHDRLYAHTWNDFFSKNDHDGASKIFNSTDQIISQLAEPAGLNISEFRDCVDQSKHADDVDADTATARAGGITGTPQFSINGTKLSGYVSYSVIKNVIDAELKKAQ